MRRIHSGLLSNVLIFMGLVSLAFNGSGQSNSALCEVSEREAILHAQRFSSIQQATPANGTNIDVIHYRCHWFVNPANDSIKGRVVITFRPKSQTVNQFTLDMANNLVVQDIRFRSQPVNGSFTGPSTLSVSLGNQSLLPNQTDSLIITYRGKPIPSAFGSFSRKIHAGVPVIYTLSEPYGAKDWWPCKQALSDKADSIDIIVTTPSFNFVASNGLLVSETESNGNKTFHWKHKYPIVTYLIAIAVTNYTHFRLNAVVSSGDTIPIDNYPYPENLSAWQTGMAPIVQLMQYFDTLISPYPFAKEKYGHVEFAFGGGMEHQTISFMQNTDYGLQAHELVHHWFGNDITCASWQDIWLNEGFATHLAADAYVKAGFSTWKQEGQQWIDLITQAPDGSVFCSDTTDLYRIFSGRLSYGKGAMLLRMLRYQIGEQAFWTGVRNYINSPTLRFGFARTPDLVGFLEQASGQNLTEFFNDWYKGQGYPTFSIAAQLNGPQVNLEMSQSSSHPSVSFFEAKVPIRLAGNGQDTTFVVNHTENNQSFSFNTNFNVTQVEFDPQRTLLAKSNVTQVTSSKSYLSMRKLQISPSAEGRFTLSNLEPDSRILIQDSKGRVVKEMFSSSNVVEMDLRKEASGVYFVKVLSGETMGMEKVVR